MAQWGRSTDIEWIYRVEVDQAGRAVARHGGLPGAQPPDLAVPGPLRGQASGAADLHGEQRRVRSGAGGPMRFFLDAEQTQPADRAREVLMDTNPWTYQLMAQEMVREGKIEKPVEPGDARGR